MYAFYVFSLPEDTTDAAVEARYQQLVRRFAPDRAPKQFQVIRRAYEVLRTPEGRLEERLFYRDGDGMALTRDYPEWAQAQRPDRHSATEIAALLRFDDV